MLPVLQRFMHHYDRDDTYYVPTPLVYCVTVRTVVGLVRLL